MKISIVIPNYNGKENLAKNLPQVLAVRADEVIVVDDASTDGSVEAVEQRYKQSLRPHGLKEIKIFRNEKNLGFAATVNQGVKEAGGEIVLLLNTDVSPNQDFLKPLILHFSDPEVFAVGCLDKSLENGKTVLRGRGLGKWQRGFLVHKRGEVKKTNTLWVSGGSGAFRKSIWNKLEGLSQLYNPFYWEDIDLSYRALKSGYKIIFEPKSVVVHDHEKGAIKKKYSLSQIRTISYRNQFIFVWRNVTDWGLFAEHLLWLPYHCLMALIKQDWPFFLGFFQALQRLPEVIQSRTKIQPYFVKKDREVTQEFLA